MRGESLIELQVDLPMGTYIIQTMDARGRVSDKQMVIER